MGKVAATVFIAGLLAMAGVAAAEELNAAHSLAQKFFDAAAESSAKAPMVDDEADMLRRARAERPASKAANDPARTAVTQPAPKLAPAPLAQPRPANVPPIDAQMPTGAVPSKVAGTPAAQIEAKAEPPSGAKPAPLATPANEQRATLLLAIEMGGSSKMAELFQSLDPIICAGDICYVSSGLDADAIRISRKDAVKLKASNEVSQNSCKGMAGCVYRNVGLPAGAQVKLVEIGAGFRVESHALSAGLDASCTMSEDGLVCDNPLATTDFRIWVVPEATAQRAGVEAIEDAVASGLPQENVELTTDK